MDAGHHPGEHPLHERVLRRPDSARRLESHEVAGRILETGRHPVGKKEDSVLTLHPPVARGRPFRGSILERVLRGVAIGQHHGANAVSETVARVEFESGNLYASLLDGAIDDLQQILVRQVFAGQGCSGAVSKPTPSPNDPLILYVDDKLVDEPYLAPGTVVSHGRRENGTRGRDEL